MKQWIKGSLLFLTLFLGGSILVVGLFDRDRGVPQTIAQAPQGRSLPKFDFNAPPQILVQPAEVRSLPGQLDRVPLFNSDSPEWVKQEGILLSTLSPTGKRFPSAHLNHAFLGEFNLFAHHFSHTPLNQRTLYIGILLHNPGVKAATIDILQGASIQLQEAPYREHPPIMANDDGSVYSGPGARAVAQVMRGLRQSDFPKRVTLSPGQSVMLLNHPIPVKGLEKPINGRSTFMRLRSSQPVQAASMAQYAPLDPQGQERSPTLAEWETLLTQGNLAGPRDKVPTPPDQVGGQLIYGRVAGVQSGSTWKATLTDSGSAYLNIPAPQQAIAYAISTLRGGRLGTEQVQAAKMVVRYPDTAYEAHGNYGVYYDLTLPLVNPTPIRHRVTLTLETPLKEDRRSVPGLQFRHPPLTHPFFRGTVRLRYTDDQGQKISRFVHLWHRTGQVLDPLVTLALDPGEAKTVQVDFIYPPDATPPQVLTLRTLP